MRQNDFNYWLVLVGVVVMYACERAFIPDIPVNEQEIVVEGYIEAGDRATPPYIVLTRNFPFFTKIEREALEDAFVHDAIVTVQSADQAITLTEVCLNNLSPEQIDIAQSFLSTSLDSLGFNFCLYTDLTFSMFGEVGQTYNLTIEAEGKKIQATTTIPRSVPLDSLYFTEPPGQPNDTLARLLVSIPDPPNEPNFYRYFTSTDGGPIISPFSSVSDDRLFDGQQFEFPLPKAEPRDADFDLATFGLYRRGDTITLKWATLDQAHFDFWNTLEFNNANQGPFSSYTLIESNIEGGLGIWGGLWGAYYELVVEIE